MATIKSLVRMKLHLFSSTHFCFRFLSIRLELSCDIGFVFILAKQLLKLGCKLDKDGQRLLLSLVESWLVAIRFTVCLVAAKAWLYRVA